MNRRQKEKHEYTEVNNQNNYVYLTILKINEKE